MQFKNFNIKEFVSPETFKIHGYKSINLLDKELLFFIEEFHPFCAKHFGGKVTIVINDWSWGGGSNFTQRGYRDFDYYLHKLTKKLKRTPTLNEAVDYYNKSRSQHKFGRGLDFDVYVDGVLISASVIRQLIIDNRHLYWIQPITFIEDGINWNHVDTRPTDDFLVVWHVKTGDVKTYS